MPRRRSSRPPTRRRPSTESRAGVELENFSSADLRTWQRQSENLERYHVQLYYHLEGLRSLHQAQLCEALSETKPTEVILDDWVRILDYQYSLEPLSAAGSLVRGGRFNIGNDLDPAKFPVFPALYLAENYQTAYEEKFGAAPPTELGIEGHEFALREPDSFSAVNVSGKAFNLFDLRSARSLRKFAEIISRFEMPSELEELARSVGMRGPLLVTKPGELKSSLLTQDWRLYPSQYEIQASSQAFGRLLLESRFDGVIYPSTKGPRNCLALFPTNFVDSESYIEVTDNAPPGAAKLKLDSSTWKEIAE